MPISRTFGATAAVAYSDIPGSVEVGAFVVRALTE
jgi:hypothetical protein